MVRNEMENIDGRISINDIEPKSFGVYLFLTKPGDILPFIKINVHIADTELENNEIAIDIMGKLEEQEHDIPFADVSAMYQLGQQYKDIPISQYRIKCIGIDPGFSSSSTAIVMCEHLKDEDKIVVRETELIEKGDPNAIADKLFNYHRKYWNLYFLIDGSNRAMVNLLKIKFGESLTWDSKYASPHSMKVVPVNFATEHKQMLSHLHMMVTKGYLSIPEEHDKLITSLRTANAKELTLDKEQTSYDDLLDGLRLSLKGYNIN